MIISHKHKFIFIKTRKTASTSIEILLSSILGKEDIITPISPVDEKKRYQFCKKKPQNFIINISKYKPSDITRILKSGKPLQFQNHDDVGFVKSHINDEVWNTYYKFAFDRNPWDKCISMYYYEGGSEKYQNFKDFLMTYDLNKLSVYDQLQHKGRLQVDKIYKYEELDKSLIHISDKLNLERKLELKNIKTKSDFRNKKRKNNDYYDEESRQLVKTIFAREILINNYYLK